MTKNHKALIKQVKKTTAILTGKGRTLKEAKIHIMAALLPLKSEIDANNVFNALKAVSALED